MTVSADEGIERVTQRQRRRFDELWRDSRATALSPDLIRHRVWKAHLVAPVVDVGAGDGLLARCFAAQKIVSLDQSMTGLLKAPTSRVAGTLESLPLRSASVRTVVAAEVLEHVEDPAAALAECRRVTIAGGKLLISVPLFPLSYPEALYHRRHIGARPSLENLSEWDPEHERRYTRVALLQELSEAGWEPIEEVPIFGSATTAVLYFGEALVARIARRRVALAQHATGLDRLIERWDRPSGIAVICATS